MKDETARNGADLCGCPSLEALTAQLRRTDEAQRRCETFSHEADLKDPRPSDRGYLEKYKRAATDFKDNVEKYYALMSKLISDGILRLSQDGTRQIISCARCGHYIDSISESEKR